MKDEASKISELSQQCNELTLACSLWVAANEAKDERIEELEAECNQLRQRIGRLVRQAGRRQNESVTGKLRSVR